MGGGDGDPQLLGDIGIPSGPRRVVVGGEMLPPVKKIQLLLVELKSHEQKASSGETEAWGTFLELGGGRGTTPGGIFQA